MNDKPTKKSATRLGVAQTIKKLRGLYGNPKATSSNTERKGWQSNPSTPNNWRERLPDPATYYAARLQKLTRTNAQGWAQARCPFHDDKEASLSVHLSNPNGGWRCFAGCGGGDLLSFHMRATGQDFKAALADLLKWGGA